MSSLNNIKMTKAATLRAQANKRKVGSEATKPKPGPRPSKPTVTPVLPTYADQDAETGTVDRDDGVSEILEEESEEELHHEETTQAPATGKGPLRTKASKPAQPKAKKETRAAATAPHLSYLSLVSDFKSVPARPAKLIEFVPNFERLYAASSAVSSLLCPLKKLHKDDPSYNSVFSRLGLTYCAIYIILLARRASGSIVYEENKVLKVLEKAYDFDTCMIPGPYVAFLATFGFHIPQDRRFDQIVPAFPGNMTTIPYANTETQRTIFPHVQVLLRLAHIVASGNVADQTDDQTDPNPIAYDNHWQDGFFVIQNTEFAFAARSGPRYAGTNNRTLFNNSIVSAAQKETATRHIAYNFSLNYPFHDKKSDLVEVCNNLPIRTIPFIKDGATTFPNPTSLLAALGLDGNTRWLTTVMESLEYESKFFKGSSSLSSIGYENGQNILCISHFASTAPAPEEGWFPSLHLSSEEGNYVLTKMENVTEEDLAVANLTATIVTYSGMHNTSFLSASPSLGTIDAFTSDEFHPFSAHTRRIIRHTAPIGHRFRTHLKTEMMLPLSDVL
jgi:hypothetical protein